MIRSQKQPQSSAFFSDHSADTPHKGVPEILATPVCCRSMTPLSGDPRTLKAALNSHDTEDTVPGGGDSSGRTWSSTSTLQLPWTRADSSARRREVVPNRHSVDGPEPVQHVLGFTSADAVGHVVRWEEGLPQLTLTLQVGQGVACHEAAARSASSRSPSSSRRSSPSCLLLLRCAS